MPESGLQMGWLRVQIENDIHPSAPKRDPKSQKGILACRTAAGSIRGKFHIDESAEIFVATLEIPAYIVPPDLEALVHAR
jgi:hypothetical protein